MEWYYGKDGLQAGPVSDTDIQALVQDGTLNPDSLIWREGMSDWQPANQVLNLTTTNPPPVPASQKNSVSNTVQPPAGTEASGRTAAHSIGDPIPSGTVPTYLWQSICCIIFCCWPFAIPALVSACKVNPALERGDLAEAQKASSEAKKWC